MKKIIVILITVIMLSGCASFQKVKEKAKEKWNEINPESNAQEQAIAVIDCIKNNDISGFKELLAENVRFAPDLDDRIDNVFTFINGDIDSYGEIKLLSCYSAKDSGEISTVEGTVEISGVKTNSKDYSIYLFIFFANSDKKEEGIQDMKISETDSSGKTINGSDAVLFDW